ncbi:MAG: dihydroorotate dehydrogenase electron transfer subunit [Defluviitaleaceae bacterium]|nr:dihydroorotate dehydrogenase electron transfer subunit [Defluviitaleaceae bacterium]
MREMQLTKTLIFSNEEIAYNIFSMTLHAPEIAQKAVAGQFVMLYLDRGELLLPRPISICDTDLTAGTIELMYYIAGKGTAQLSKLGKGEEIQILAPLGNGFTLAPDSSRVAIVGGGIGIPPLFFLAKTLARSGVEFDVFLGFRSTPILVEKFKAITKGNIYISTEDGSVGHHGRVDEILYALNESYAQIFSCGPVPMLRAIAKLAKHAATPCQVSMEERMACGLGTCVGCVVKVGGSYVRVCCEGPVFCAEGINWEE